MNAYTELAAKITETLRDLAAHHERVATPRKGTAEMTAFNALEWGYSRTRAIAETVRAYCEAYIALMVGVTNADELNGLFSMAARDALDVTEHAARNPNNWGDAAKRDALLSFATTFAGRDFRRDAQKDARELMAQRVRSCARRLVFGDEVAALRDEYARLGGDGSALTEEFFKIADEEKARRKAQEKKDAAKARREARKSAT